MLITMRQNDTSPSDRGETNFRGAGQTEARQFLRSETETLVIGGDNNANNNNNNDNNNAN